MHMYIEYLFLFFRHTHHRNLQGANLGIESWYCMKKKKTKSNPGGCDGMVWLRKNDENIYEVVEGTFVKHRCKPTGKANKDRRDVSK